MRAGGVDRQNLEFLDLDLNRVEYHFFVLAGELVGRHALNFLRRKWRWKLLDDSAKSGGYGFKFIFPQNQILRRACGLAFGVVGIGGKTKTNGALVGLLGGVVELGEASEAAHDQRKDAGGHGIEGAEMADGALIQDAADTVDDVVRSESGGLVDDENGVHGNLDRKRVV